MTPPVLPARSHDTAGRAGGRTDVFWASDGTAGRAAIIGVSG